MEGLFPLETAGREGRMAIHERGSTKGVPIEGHPSQRAIQYEPRKKGGMTTQTTHKPHMHERAQAHTGMSLRAHTHRMREACLSQASLREE